MEPVRVAAVGLGRWANVLAGAYTRSDMVKLVTCFSRGSAKRDAFSARYGCGQDESLEAMLQRDDVEAVIVTVPNDQHADVIEQAAAAGKHVYVEKPIAIALDDALRIQRATTSAGVVFLCGHSARRLGGLRTIKSFIESGEIGDVSMIEATFANERGLELKPGDWRGDPGKAPGGPLTQLGIHQIDNLQFLLGPVKQVFCIGKSLFTKVPNETVLQTVMEFEDGRMAYLGTNWACPGHFMLNVYATRSNLFYDLDFSWWSNSNTTDEHSQLMRTQFASFGADPDDRVLEKSIVQFAHTDHLRDEIDEFARAIRTGEPVEIDAAFAVRNLAVVIAAMRSVHERRLVTIAEVLQQA